MRALRATSFCLATFGVLASLASAADPASGYDQPPRNILDVMRAPSPPVPYVSATEDRMLLVSWQDYPSIERVATPFLRLAGVRVEPANHSKHDTPGGYGITPCALGFELIGVPGGTSTPVPLPPTVCAGAPIWSADGKRFAFTNTAPHSVELWIGDGDTGAVRQVPAVRLNPMFDHYLQWMPDQKSLLVKLVPPDQGPAPVEAVRPVGPRSRTGPRGSVGAARFRLACHRTGNARLGGGTRWR